MKTFQSSEELLAQPQRQNFQSVVEYNTGNQESDGDQFIPRVNLMHRNQTEDKFLLRPRSKKDERKEGQASSRSRSRLKRADITKDINTTKFRKNNAMSILNRSNYSSYLIPVVDKNDDSDIINKFNINLNERPIDQKRANMLITGGIAGAGQKLKKDDIFFMVVEKEPIERVEDIKGRCPGIKKLLCRIRINTSSTARAIITSKVFEAISLIVIIANSFSLAIEDPTATESPFYQEVMDNIFLALYSIEMVLKILGMGFAFNKGAYIRDAWNLLDFVIVMTGYLQLLFQGGSLNLSGLRSFRVLRPLRSIQRIQGLKLIVSALLNSMPLLRDTLIVLVFFFFIFSIAGLQLFSGILKRRCIALETGIVHPNDIMCGYDDCPSGYFCGKRNTNPNFDQTNFDTIFYALITIFTSVTLEGWTYNMRLVNQTFTNMSFLFFVPLVFIGAFFLLNLTLAVIKSKFTKEHEKNEDKKRNFKNRRKRNQKEEDPFNVPPEFEHLDSEDEKKIVNLQETTRPEVLKKWRLIMFIKRKMRINVKNYQKKKIKEARRRAKETLSNGAAETQQPQQFGLTDYASLFGPDITPHNELEQTQKELLHHNKSETEFQQPLMRHSDSATQFQISSMPLSSQISLVQLDDKLKNFAPSQSQKFTAFQNFRTLNQDPIAEEDDEYKTEFSNIIGNGGGLMHLSSGNMVKPRGGSAGSKGTPVSPSGQDLISVRRSSSKNINNRSLAKGMSFQNLQQLRQQEQENDRITVFTPEKKQINMIGMVGLKQKKVNKIVKNENSQRRRSIKIDMDFFREFIDQDIELLDQKFTEHELLEIAQQFEDPQNIQNSSQILEILDEESEQFSEVSIFTDEYGRKSYPAQIAQGTHNSEFNDERNNTPYTTTTALVKGNTYHRQRSKNTHANFLSQDLSISEDSHLDNNLDTEGNQNEVKVSPYSHRPSTQPDGAVTKSNDMPLSKQITDIKGSSENEIGFGRSKTLDQENEPTENLYRRKQPRPIQANFRQESPFQNQSATMASTTLQNGTLYSEANPLIKNNTPTHTLKTRDNLVDMKAEKISKTKIRPIGAGSYKEDTEHQRQKHGPNTISNAEYIDLDKSVLNSRFLIEDQMKIHQKIHLRNDKFIFQSQTDIFEQRDEISRKIQHAENRRKAIEFERNWNVKAYQRKQLLTPKVYKPDEEQSEFLQKLEMDPNELEKLIQKKYNEPYISNLYVTGTLSICIYSKKDNQTNKIRKNQDIELQTYYDEISELQGHSNSPSISMNQNMQPESPLRRKQSRVYKTMDLQTRYINDLSNVVFFKNQSNPVISKSLKKTRAGITMHSIIAEQRKQNKFEDEIKATQMRRDALLNRAAAKDANLQRKLILTAMTKDGYRSQFFRALLIKRRSRMSNEDRQKRYIMEIFDMYKEEEDENQDEDDDEAEESSDEEGIKDDFIDWPIDFTAEILKAKKAAAFSKKSLYNWSGQDILCDYDPEHAKEACSIISNIRVWPESIHGIWKKIQTLIKSFIRSSFFDNFLTMCVFINTVCLALDRHNINPEEERVLAQMNTVFTYIFIGEMSLKIIGLGPVKYLKDRMNYLDGIVVTLSIVEMGIVSGTTGALSAFRAVRIFRIFRVLRVARLLRSMQSMQVIIGVLVKSMNSFVYLALLLILFLFIYSLLGMQVFGNQYKFENNFSGPAGIPRNNFNNFNSAFLTAFQILTMESWPALFYDALRSPVNKVVSALYFLSWVFLGNFMLLNLFLAILLDSFTTENHHKKDEEESEKQKFQKHLDELAKKEAQELIEYYQDDKESGDIKGGPKGLNKKKKKKKKKDENMLDESFEFDKEALNRKQPVTKKAKVDFEGVECERSFYIFTKQWKIRYYLYKACTHTCFETIIQILILLSSIKLVIDTYLFDLPEDSLLKIVSDDFDKFFTTAFATESLIKAISFGLIQDKGSYLRETWSQLDFFIVITSLIDAAFENINLPIIKILRLLRTLRPLRFISHNSGMKTIVMALLQSVGGIFNVAIVVMIVWMMFAILAVNLFGGKLQYCTIDTYMMRNKVECLKNRGEWKTFDYNFDSVPTAMITMFSLATLENWPDIMYNTINAVGEDVGPKLNANPSNGYFFVVYIFIGSFLFLNLFVGVIFKEFEEAQEEEKQGLMLTDKQIRWVDMMKMIVNSNPDIETTNVPKQKWRAKVHSFITGLGRSINYFDIFIMSCIILNMLQMAVIFEGSSEVYNNVLDKINYFFTAVFATECILKLIAFGSSYFKTTWNLFDFFVVSASMFDIAMNTLNASSLKFLRVGPQLARVLRVLRVSRLFRLVNKYKGLQALIQTIQFSLPSLFNVFSLLMLVYFIFAVLGTFLFRQITTGTIINDSNNFTNFGMAMLMCIRMSTGEDWNYIMFDTMRTEADDCIPGINCGISYAPVYFIPYMMISTFIMLNLFILVILQQFELYYLQDNNVLNKFKEDLELFKKTWTDFTRNENCLRIKDTRLVNFFAAMEPQLGMKGMNPNQIIRHVMQMDFVADSEGFIYFNELLFKAMRREYGEKHVKNKILVQHELNAMRKIENIKMKLIKKKLTQERQEAGQVNPFMLNMYMNASFRGWLSIFNKNREKRDLERTNYLNKYELETEGNEEIKKQIVNNVEDLEWGYQTVEDFSVSDDEFNDQLQPEIFSSDPNQETNRQQVVPNEYISDSDHQFSEPDDQIDSSRMLRRDQHKRRPSRQRRDSQNQSVIIQQQRKDSKSPLYIQEQPDNDKRSMDDSGRNQSQPPPKMRKIQTEYLDQDFENPSVERNPHDGHEDHTHQKTISPKRRRDNVLISSRSGSGGDQEEEGGPNANGDGNQVNLRNLNKDDPNDIVLLKINMQKQKME